MSYRQILPAILLLCFLSDLQAQRAVAIFDPGQTDPELRFDINEFPVDRQLDLTIRELNFSPNVVFTLDSTRAFVTFPGSHRVAVFDTASGDMIQVLETRTNPTSLTMTPDGKKLAAPCIFLLENAPSSDNFDGQKIGAISMIDVESLQVTHLDLTETVFSFANNIVFSSDSKTGFVASSRTDELIRFDVDTLTEIGNRLQFAGGTRPSSITMAPDRSFFGVVLVGSSLLPRFETPDSIQIVDTETFQIGKSLAFTVEPPDLPYNFLAANTVAFSQDGTMAMIAEQGRSLGSIIPEFVSDRALLIDIEAEEIVQTYALGTGTLDGGVSAGSFLSPDGRFFIVLSELNIDVIDIPTQGNLSIAPFFREFQPTTRPSFSADGSVMYIASPFNDFLMTFRPATGEIVRGLRIGGNVELEVGGVMANFPSAPLDVRVSPDGKTIAVLDFNANQVELFKPTFFGTFPQFDNFNGFTTGIALANLSDQTAEVKLTAIDRTGVDFADQEPPEEPVEGEEPVLQMFDNPTVVDLAPNEQITFTADGLLNPVPNVPFSGWLDAESDFEGLVGMFLTFGQSVKRLDGGSISNRTLPTGVLPEVRISDGFNTTITMVNPNQSATFVSLSLFDEEGMPIEQSTFGVPAEGRASFPVRDPDPDDAATSGIFTDAALEDFDGGYVVFRSGIGVRIFETYSDPDRLAVLDGISSLSSSIVGTFTRFSVPHFVASGGFDTMISLINLSLEMVDDEPVNMVVTLTLRDDAGAAIGEPVEVELSQFFSTRFSVKDLFQLEDTGAAISGWIEVVADHPGAADDSTTRGLGLAGTSELQAFSGRALSANHLQVASQTDFIFPHVAQNSALSTGLVFLNSESETATLRVELRRQDGSMASEANFVLEPGQRRAQQLTELFPGLDEEFSGGTIRVFSDNPVNGLVMFFTNDLETLSIIPSQEIDVPVIEAQ